MTVQMLLLYENKSWKEKTSHLLVATFYTPSTRLPTYR